MPSNLTKFWKLYPNNSPFGRRPQHRLVTFLYKSIKLIFYFYFFVVVLCQTAGFVLKFASRSIRGYWKYENNTHLQLLLYLFPLEREREMSERQNIAQWWGQSIRVYPWISTRNFITIFKCIEIKNNVKSLI